MALLLVDTTEAEKFAALLYAANRPKSFPQWGEIPEWARGEYTRQMKRFLRRLTVVSSKDTDPAVQEVISRAITRGMDIDEALREVLDA